MSDFNKKKAAEFVKDQEELDELFLIEGHGRDATQMVLGKMLEKVGITPITILQELANVATGKAVKTVRDGSGDVLTTVDDPKTRLAAIDRIVNLFGMPQQSRKESRAREDELVGAFEEEEVGDGGLPRLAWDAEKK